MSFLVAVVAVLAVLTVLNLLLSSAIIRLLNEQRQPVVPAAREHRQPARRCFTLTRDGTLDATDVVPVPARPTGRPTRQSHERGRRSARSSPSLNPRRPI